MQNIKVVSMLKDQHAVQKLHSVAAEQERVTLLCLLIFTLSVKMDSLLKIEDCV